MNPASPSTTEVPVGRLVRAVAGLLLSLASWPLWFGILGSIFYPATHPDYWDAWILQASFAIPFFASLAAFLVFEMRRRRREAAHERRQP